LIVVHLARKPLSESSVASNVLQHGVGALNINASRIHGVDAIEGRVRHGGGSNQVYAQDEWTLANQATMGSPQPAGRWPANLILQHRPGCRCEGAKQLRSSAEGKSGGHSWGLVNDDGWEPRGVPDTRPWLGPDGLETVPDWRCSSGCPVADLDDSSLSNGMHSAGGARRKFVTGEVEASSFNMGGTRDMFRLGDSGGASRFFKQVGGTKE